MNPLDVGNYEFHLGQALDLVAASSYNRKYNETARNVISTRFDKGAIRQMLYADNANG